MEENETERKRLSERRETGRRWRRKQKITSGLKDLWDKLGGKKQDKERVRGKEERKRRIRAQKKMEKRWGWRNGGRGGRRAVCDIYCSSNWKGKLFCFAPGHGVEKQEARGPAHPHGQLVPSDSCSPFLLATHNGSHPDPGHLETSHADQRPHSLHTLWLHHRTWYRLSHVAGVLCGSDSNHASL